MRWLSRSRRPAWCRDRPSLSRAEILEKGAVHCGSRAMRRDRGSGLRFLRSRDVSAIASSFITTTAAAFVVPAAQVGRRFARPRRLTLAVPTATAPMRLTSGAPCIRSSGCPRTSPSRPGAAVRLRDRTGFSALKRLDLMGDETIAIFGQGPVGLSGTMFAHAMGARVIAMIFPKSACRWRNPLVPMSSSIRSR